MLIGIISDSHDHIGHIAKAAALFKEHACDLVVHAGDICSPPALRKLEGLPLAGVLGNNDGEKLGLYKTFEKFGAQFTGDFLELDIDGKKGAVYHGTATAVTATLIESGRYGYVITGHTHDPVDDTVGQTRVLNPGTAHGFGKTATVMIYNSSTDKAELFEL
ncbi:MAG: metallophosphoesterase [Magnetococcales bacterium]|nr:metallophosphoesterase [Magnetococcales bacterium]